MLFLFPASQPPGPSQSAGGMRPLSCYNHYGNGPASQSIYKVNNDLVAGAMVNNLPLPALIRSARSSSVE